MTVIFFVCSFFFEDGSIICRKRSGRNQNIFVEGQPFTDWWIIIDTVNWNWNLKENNQTFIEGSTWYRHLKTLGIINAVEWQYSSAWTNTITTSDFQLCISSCDSMYISKSNQRTVRDTLKYISSQYHYFNDNLYNFILYLR